MNKKALVYLFVSIFCISAYSAHNSANTLDITSVILNAWCFMTVGALGLFVWRSIKKRNEQKIPRYDHKNIDIILRRQVDLENRINGAMMSLRILRDELGASSRNETKEDENKIAPLLN